MGATTPTKTLTIASGGTTSDVWDVSYGGAMVSTVIVIAPSALTGTITIEVSSDGSRYGTLQSGGSDINIAAAKAVPLTELTCNYLRIKSGSAEGAERTFHLIARGRGGAGSYG